MPFALALPIFFTLAVVLSGCGESRDKTHMERSFNLVDADNKQAGQVKLHGVGGGEIVDNDGKVIGRIVPTDTN